MTPITKALERVRQSIPRPILEQAFLGTNFLTRSPFANTPVSMDYLIREKVINCRVLVDCNINGPKRDEIPLTGLPMERIDGYNTLVRISKDRTKGRTIIAAYSVGFAANGIVAGPSYGGAQATSALVDAAYAVMQATLPIPNMSNNQVFIAGENTILITDSLPSITNLVLYCGLEHDEEMSSLKPASWSTFASMTLLAVKAYIYQELAIKLDFAQVQAGVTIGRFKEFVDSYADADEQYEEMLKNVWRKVAIMNDDKARRRMVGMSMGRR